MNLSTYFSTLCRQLGVNLKTEVPIVKPLLLKKKKDNKNGSVARYNFGEFTMDIYYIENLKGGAVQQVIWLSFFFDKEPSITFSVYDILSVTDPQNFNRYTYSYVDSVSLLEACFSEIEALLEALLPKLSDIAGNGVEKNKLIDTQKQKINSYFGDNIFDAAQFLNDSADKILSMMFYNFFQHQIDIYVIGSAALFFDGKTEKALKVLKKAKYRSLYEDKLLEHLENGGKAPKPSEAAEEASAKKGKSRQGTDAKGSLKLFLCTLLLSIPVAVLLTGVFLLLTYITATDGLFVFGIKENILFITLTSLLPSIAVTLNIFSNKKIKKGDIQAPPLPQSAKALLKYFTILIETLALITAFTCANSTLVLRDNDFLYSTEDFPLSRSACEYSTIDYVAVVEGYTYKGEFQKDPHIAFVTKSGTTIDVYNATFFSAEEFKEKTEEFWEEKGIPFKQIQAIE